MLVPPLVDTCAGADFYAGFGISYAFAFPSVWGSGTPLARAKCPEGQGESS